jgi:hypothetical protein
LHSSIDRILDLRPKGVYVTHYSRLGHVERLGADLHADVDEFARIARGVADGPERAERIESLLFEHMSVRLDAHGFAGGDAERHAVLDADLSLNAAGLLSWLSRRS